MGMGVQGLVVRDGRIENCPRLAGVQAIKCLTKCKYSRSAAATLKKGFSMPPRMDDFKIEVVYCDKPTLAEFT
jgi:hypothetical protein